MLAGTFGWDPWRAFVGEPGEVGGAAGAPSGVPGEPGGGIGRTAPGPRDPEPPRAGEVPALVGLRYPEAEAVLERAGFVLGGVEEVASDGDPAGVIANQDPRAGTAADPGTPVLLTTSVEAPDGADGQYVAPQYGSPGAAAAYR